MFCGNKMFPIFKTYSPITWTLGAALNIAPFTSGTVLTPDKHSSAATDTQGMIAI